MGIFALPASLVEYVRTSKSAEMRDWFDRLPQIVQSFVDRWSLRLGEAYQPGGKTAWTAPAVDAMGRDLVLKVGWAHTEALHEPDGLRAWQGNGAAYLYENYVDGPSSALLLERCEPGTTLKSRPIAEQDVVVAEVLTRLWSAPVEGPFRCLQSMCDFWADGFERDRERAEGYDVDAGIVRAGVQLFRELPGTADRQALLATDLHAENILAATRMPWLAIDPKPYVGDPTYDPLQHLLNCPLLPDPMARVNRMADLLDLDPERLRLWLFARCVVESGWMPELRPVAWELRPR